ncbi:MAG: MAPEG family protein [Roseovarius sp.]
MALSVSPLYAGLLALLFIALSFRVIFQRIATRQSLGDGGDKALETRIRVQGNFAEYTTFALILLLLVELQGAPLWVVHLLGAALLAGRLAHAWGMSATPMILPLRQGGMVLTFLMMGLAGLGLIGHALL